MDSSTASDADTLQANQLEKGEKNSIPDSSSDSNGEISPVNESDFVSGYQLFLLVFAISMAGFLYALDVNIIVTVSPTEVFASNIPLTYIKGNSSHHNSFQDY